MALTLLDPRTLEPGTADDSPAGHGRHPAEARSVSRAAWLGCGAAGFGIAFVTAYFLFVHTVVGQRVENGVVRNAQSAGSPAWAEPLRHADMIITLGVAGLLVLLITALRRQLGLGFAAMTALTAPLLAAQVLKLYVLERPPMDDGTSVAGHNSFPSGHVSAALAIVLAVALMLPRQARPAALLAGSFGVAWVAAAAVQLGWHRLSDTVGGCLLVAAVFCAVAAVRAARRPGSDHSKSGHPNSGRVAIVPLVIVLLAPLAIVLGGFAVLLTATSGAAQFVAALILAAVSAVLVVLLLQWQTHDTNL